MRYHLAFFFLFVAFIFTPSGFAAEFYSWLDERGEIHYTGALADVPQRFRKEVLIGQFEEKGNISYSVGSVKEIEDHRSSPVFPLPEKGLSVDPASPKQYKIPYLDREGTARRVIIDVTFNDRVTVPVLFDTGAYETIIFPDLADQLNLFDQDTPELWVAVGGIGGTAPALRAVLDSMKIGDFKNTFVPVTITNSMSDDFKAIIGLDFISNYTVEISPVEKTIVFEEVKPDKPLYGGHDEIWWRTYFTEFESHRNTWRAWRDALKRALRTNVFNLRLQQNVVKEELVISNYYLGESDRLFSQLNRYANQHAVPVDWRRESRQRKPEKKK